MNKVGTIKKKWNLVTSDFMVYDTVAKEEKLVSDWTYAEGFDPKLPDYYLKLTETVKKSEEVTFSMIPEIFFAFATVE